MTYSGSLGISLFLSYVLIHFCSMVLCSYVVLCGTVCVCAASQRQRDVCEYEREATKAYCVISSCGHHTGHYCAPVCACLCV